MPNKSESNTSPENHFVSQKPVIQNQTNQNKVLDSKLNDPSMIESILLTDKGKYNHPELKRELNKTIISDLRNENSVGDDLITKTHSIIHYPTFSKSLIPSPFSTIFDSYEENGPYHHYALNLDDNSGKAVKELIEKYFKEGHHYQPYNKSDESIQFDPLFNLYTSISNISSIHENKDEVNKEENKKVLIPAENQNSQNEFSIPPLIEDSKYSVQINDPLQTNNQQRIDDNSLFTEKSIDTVSMKNSLEPESLVFDIITAENATLKLQNDSTAFNKTLFNNSMLKILPKTNNINLDNENLMVASFSKVNHQ
ncbi:hypothetical protein CEXT_265231 [Caerostris extrusa]|uniref:Uncharacterized protein n=1 Tax=Caerostris extrusa TaxID=172846 RepID=A0AAV4UU51_CAEEX|nr:hypothetical protein CEXT_265231 [Caerostris extrusa]